MADSNNTDDTIEQLQTIVDRLSDLNKYNKSIEEHCARLDKVTKTLEQNIREQQSRINEFEKKISKQYDEFTSMADSLEGKIKQYSGLIEKFVERSTVLADSVNTFERYKGAMEAISSAFESQIEEARSIQNKILMEKMDLLISKAEKLASEKDTKTTEE